MDKKEYMAPQVELMECKVERGFVMSSDGTNHSPEPVTYSDDQGAKFN